MALACWRSMDIRRGWKFGGGAAGEVLRRTEPSYFVQSPGDETTVQSKAIVLLVDLQLCFSSANRSPNPLA